MKTCQELEMNKKKTMYVPREKFLGGTIERESCEHTKQMNDQQK